ncbi:ABC transporter ATP-binding protein [Aliikangiella coralliicola]|uniref:ABC transporter ATP-binding protein n=1 Tax=Aliikangiella coralliicola TaxID=2592383 RepID=A0A545TWI0_9GAMM|nr:ABC transporter ATP-binding protein [Aliikangiella coralliicola]TQV81569.1 ABC transporter ATP-binding protein [Aliikangiella coralliicola]
MLTAIKLGKQVTTGDTNLTILDDISFELEEGKSLAILGESGSGKTTLLGLLAGLDTPTEGQVLLKNQSIFDLTEEQRAQSRKENLGFVFQSFQLIEGLTALENVMMPLELKGDKLAREKATEMLQKVGLGERLKHYSNQLSGGEQQRVAIARAFVTEPKLLLADEPTGNLDTATGEKIIELMFSLNKELNTTLVLVTHDIHLAEKCNESLILNGGKIISKSSNLGGAIVTPSNSEQEAVVNE